MRTPPAWRRYLRLFGPDPEADARDEVRFHIASKAAELVDEGLSPEDAEREAERQFGDRTAVEAVGARLGRERVRRGLARECAGAIAQDLRYAWRTLGKERGFAFVAISVLALGIATNTAVFSVVNTVMLRPLPFPHAEQLVWLESGRNSIAAGRKSNGLSTETYTMAAYQEIQRGLGSFQGIASYNPFFANSEYTLVGRGEPQSVAGVWVSENFFQTLGVKVAAGRLFAADECRHGGPPATLLSNAFWRQSFGADPGIVGRTVRLRQGPGEGSATVVGVLPENFDFGAVFAPGVRFDMFFPAVLDEMRDMGNTLALVGRLKPGVSVAQAQSEAGVAIPQIQASHKEWWGDYTSSITGLGERVAGKLRRPLVALWGAAGLILLIACVNLSNLLLARGAAREREFALRSALGAGRARLFRQLLTEGALLTAAGAACGVALAFALVEYLSRQDAIALPLLSQAKLDGSALLWTILIASAVTLLFGLVPALTLRGRDLQTPLKTAAHGSTGSRRRESFRSALVVSEVALACVLAVGAGLLLRSFLKVLDVDLGFQPDHAAVMRVDYDDGGQRARRGPVLQEILRRIAAIPGVNAAGVGDMLPLGRNRSWALSAKGKSYDKTVQQNALVRVVTPGYLRAMGMRLAAGRDFEWTDGIGSENVVILNQAAVRRFWGDEDPFGRLAVAGGRDTRVVGVIADVRANSMETAAGPEMYLPVMQRGPEGAELVIRASLPPEALAASVMKTLRELNPAQPATELRPLRDIVDRSVSPRRFFVWLVAGFAGLGLTLASLGVYGVISYSVARRHREIGIRMALGASAARVRTAVIGRALALALAGMAAGGAASFAVARWMEPLLFGVKPSDVGTFAAIALLLGAAAYAGGYLPARRAARIDPAVALRAGE